MNSKAPKKKVAVKSVHYHVIRAKLYAILTMNALEGMMMELNSTLGQDYNGPRIDILSEQFRQYQNSDLFPTSHGDYIDRAVKSLAKQLGVPVGVELQNAQAVKKVIMSIARSASEQERKEIHEWLSESNDMIVRSPHYEKLIDQACLYFYKRPASEVSEDTLAFIRRSANELLRNKSSKEAMRKRLCAEDEETLDKIIHEGDGLGREYDLLPREDDNNDGQDTDDELILNNEELAMINRKRGKVTASDEDGDFVEKRTKNEMTL